MKKYLVKKEDLIVVEKLVIADRFFQRLVGLLRHKSLEPGAGLLIRPCQQIHTFGMRFDIDAVFLSNLQVIYIIRNMKPGQISKLIGEADSVLELEAGAAATLHIQLRDSLKIEPWPVCSSSGNDDGEGVKFNLG